MNKCLQLTEEFRHLSENHSNHEDKLQVCKCNTCFHGDVYIVIFTLGIIYNESTTCHVNIHVFNIHTHM